MLCPTVGWLVSWVSNSPMVGLCFFQLSNDQTVLCPKVQLSNSWTVLCLTVQWLVNAESNCAMDGQLSVQLSNGRTVLCLTVQWHCDSMNDMPQRASQWKTKIYLNNLSNAPSSNTIVLLAEGPGYISVACHCCALQLDHQFYVPLAGEGGNWSWQH